MTEQDGAGKNNQNELTSQANSSNLEREGDIFMPDGTNGGPEQPHGPEEPKSNQEPHDSGQSGPLNPDAHDSGQQDNAQGYADNEGGSETPPPGESPHQESDADDNNQNRAEEETERLKQEAINRRKAAKENLEKIFPELTKEEIGELEKTLKFKEIEEKIDIDARRARTERRQIGVPNSLEDLAELIMKSSDPAKWGKEGTEPLIDENGKVNVVNFLDWSRNNMFRVHNANPTSPINFFSDIGTSVRNDVYGSQISFYEIVFTESIFLDKTIENGKEVTKRNDDYEALRQQLLMETFLFSLVRNPDITYFLNRGQGEKMLKALEEGFAVNPLTRGNFFEFIFTMPSMHKKSINDLEASADNIMQAKQEGNFYMGDAARQALSAYMNIFDYDQLVTIFGKDAPLFRRDYESWDADSGKRKVKDKITGEFAPDEKIEQDALYPKKREKEWFDENGSIQLYAVDANGKYVTRRVKQKVENDEVYIDKYEKDSRGLPHPEYMRYINVFLTPNPDQRQQSEARLRITLSIMENNGISFREAQLAELWAYSMTHIHGVAAEMDTDAVAYDWWTRLVRLKEYRKRQKADRRGAPYGGNHNLEGFKRIGLTFFEAARDIRGRSIKNIIQGGTGRNVDIKNNPLKNRVDYERDERGNIIFRRGEEIVTEIVARDYEIYDEEIVTEGEKKQKKTSVRFKDANGQLIEVGEATPTVKISKVDVPVQFKADLQKQFLPNHMLAGAGFYEFIMKQTGLNLPELVTGYDTRGNPIIDQAKLLEIKAKIEHDIRYSLSTWPEINYGEKEVRAERVEVRSSRGRLIAKKRGENDEELELDEDWHILDSKGKRTSERNEPETYLRSREMTMLESMFGVDALKHIQFEIVRHGLANGRKENQDDFINAEDERGKRVKVDISEARKQNHEFSIAVWQGAFDYLIASEIEAHRDRNSGLRYYDSTDIKKSSDAMIVGELATQDRVKNIRKETNTRARRIYSQDFAYAFATGGAGGMWKVFEMMFKDILSGK